MAPPDNVTPPPIHKSRDLNVVSLDSVKSRENIMGSSDDFAPPSPHQQDKSSCRSNLLGYTFAFLVIVTYTIAVVSAQLSVSTTPVFQRSCMRYVAQSLITLVTIVVCQSSVKVARRHLYMIVIIAVFDFAYNYSFYLAAAYLPVGNMEGIFTCLIIIILGLYDIVRKKCEAHQIIAGLICSVGLLLLVQPWGIGEELKKVTDKTSSAPCESLGTATSEEAYAESDRIITTTGIWFDDDKYTGKPVNMNLTTGLFSITDANVTLLASENTTSFTKSSDIGSESYINDIWIGYVLIISATICMAVISVFIEKMTAMLNYHPASVSFWVSLLNAMVSIILMLSLEVPKLPSAAYCLLFTFLLAILSACNAFFSHITLKYLLPSQTALLLSLSMVVLFICQNTSLPGVQSGRGNVAEIVGAVITFVGAISSPIYQLVRRSSQKSDQVYEVSFQNGGLEEGDEQSE